jgi:hypothetical protein
MTDTSPATEVLSRHTSCGGYAEVHSPILCPHIRILSLTLVTVPITDIQVSTAFVISVSAHNKNSYVPVQTAVPAADRHVT